MSELDGLYRERDRCKQRLDSIKKRIVDIKIAAFESATGVGIGSVVVNGRGKEFRVATIEPWSEISDTSAWIRGNPRLKSGEWGKSVQHVSNWRLPGEQGTDT